MEVAVSGHPGGQVMANKWVRTYRKETYGSGCMVQDKQEGKVRVFFSFSFFHYSYPTNETVRGTELPHQNLSIIDDVKSRRLAHLPRITKKPDFFPPSDALHWLPIPLFPVSQHRAYGFPPC
jgi:hypothetical protein